MANALKGVAALFAGQTGEAPSFLGTSFALRTCEWFVTARHCIGGLAPSELAVVSPMAPIFSRTVREIISHPVADIALLRVAPVDASPEDDPAEPFWGWVSNFSLGEDFLTFGFPESVFGEEPAAPTPRVFKGSFQRFMAYESHAGFRYIAGELSIAAPVGLSGGPLFRPGAPQMLTGMVTENLESSTAIDAVEEVITPSVTHRTQYQRVISYGVALMFAPIADWLDEHGPPPQQGQQLSSLP